ncbi:MAG: pilus assembly FimT family protein [Phycisphaerales bacterium]
MRATHPIPISRPRRGFTILELLAAITIIILALAAIVPAFGRILESANYSASVNRVTAALSLARAEAMKGKQTAVAFYFDLETQRTTMHLLERRRTAGALTRRSEDTCNPSAFVFVPIANQAPITLPPGVGVYGLAMSAAIPAFPCENEELDWYPGEAIRASSSGEIERFWIFPRNDARLFIDDALWDELPVTPTLAQWLDASRYAETFFIRFDEHGAILPSVEFGTGASLLDAYVEFAAPTSLVNVVPNPDESSVVFDPEEPEFEDTLQGRFGINREAQVRSVDYLAIVDLGRLADETGIQSPWYVRPDSDQTPDDSYSQLPGLAASDPKVAFIDTFLGDDTDTQSTTPRSPIHRISRWIDTNAEIISFNRATGEALRRGAQ